MRRRHKTALMVLLVAMGLLGVAMALWPREPTYQGKRLSQWLEDLGSDNPDRRVQATRAVRQMGTIAIPGLLASMRAKDSRFKVGLINVVGEQRLAKLGFVLAQEHHRRAAMAFMVLGPAAKPAIPDLTVVLNDGDSSRSAVAALSAMMPEAMYALTNAYENPDSRVRLEIIQWVRCEAIAQRGGTIVTDLFVRILLLYLEDKDPDVRGSAAEVLGGLEIQPDRVVPALVKLLQDGELYPRSAAVRALGGFGTRAKAAVPALVEYTKKAGNKSERDEAIKALKEIDPEAVTKAGLE